MLSGLEILLARAKEYPEEFSNPNGKWRTLIKEIIPYLDKDEMMHLEMAMKEVMRSKFNEAVLTTLAGVSAQAELNDMAVKNPNPKKSAIPSAAAQNQMLGALNRSFDEAYKDYEAFAGNANSQGQARWVGEIERMNKQNLLAQPKSNYMSNLLKFW